MEGETECSKCKSTTFAVRSTRVILCPMHTAWFTADGDGDAK